MFVTKSVKLIALLLVLVVGLSLISTISASAGLFGPDLQVNNDGTVVSASNSTADTFGKIMEKYKGVITFVGGIATVTMVAIFILNFMKLGSTSTNPTERQKVLTGLIWSGIAAALLGSVTLIVGVFYGMLK